MALIHTSGKVVGEIRVNSFDRHHHSSSSPSAPCTLLNMPGDVLGKIMGILGPGHYRYIAGSCHCLRDAYMKQHPGNFLTSDESIAGSEQTAAIFVNEKGRVSRQFLKIALWASRHGRLALLKWAHQGLDCYPYGYIFPSVNRLPDEAAKGGHIDCFEFLLDRHDWNSSSRMNYFKTAAQNGHLVFLRYFHEKKQGLHLILNDGSLCSKAAECGQIGILRYLHETAKSHWDHKTCHLAALNGHLGCLRYAHENGCPLYSLNRDVWRWVDENHLQDDITCAAAHGGIGCLKYVHDCGCELHNQAFFIAAEAGHVESLVYLYENGAGSNDHAALLLAATNGHVDCLQYLFEIYGNWEQRLLKDALNKAILNRHVDALAFLLAKIDWGTLSPVMMLKEALHHGSLECFFYLVGLDCISISTALHHLAILTIDSGLEDLPLRPLFEGVVSTKGGKECLEKALVLAAKHDRLDCLTHLLEEPEYTWNNSIAHDAVRVAAKCGSLNCLTYLLKDEFHCTWNSKDENAYSWDSEQLYRLAKDAKRHGHRDCVRLLYKAVKQLKKKASP